ncbi:NACHT domain-containing protein [Actinoplanes sp. CA-015351]|uniref:NACHT domain-containing protein n=1 Tax=Actinoplanes sp. CA-015351 TaxID=3239897 RepID=UPI003D963E81
MIRAVLRFLQAALVTVAGLVVVPIAVNIETGGDAPAWLSPYIGWLWPVALLCVLLVAVLEFLARWEGRPVKPISSLHPDDPQNAPLALAQVTHYIEGRQKGALDEKVRLALALDERPASVRQTVHLVQRISGAEFHLSHDRGIVDVFDEMSGSLLILGAPGAGKTTLLLDLAKVLAARADEARIPVVLDLADWSRSATGRWWYYRGVQDEPRELGQWLLGALRQRYGIPISVGRAWLETDRLILLLDGLDEVRTSHRDRCVEEINKLQERLNAKHVVVCSREADYDLLAGRLRLQGAVSIRPLTREQVRKYFDAISPFFARTVDALHRDSELWDLLTTPLMLNIMALAQSDGALPEATGDADPAARRGRIFDAYLVEVLARRRPGRSGTSEHVLRALALLARGSVNADAGVRIVVPDDKNMSQVASPSANACAAERIFPITYIVCVSLSTAALAAFAAGLVALFVGVFMSFVLIGNAAGANWSAARVLRPAVMLLVNLLIAVLIAGVLLAVTTAAGWIEPASDLTLVVLLAIAVVANVAVRWADGGSSDLPPIAFPLAGGVLALGLVLAAGVPGAGILAWVIGFTGALLLLGLCFPFLAGWTGDDSRGSLGWPQSLFGVLCAAGALLPAILLTSSWLGHLGAVVVGLALGVTMAVLPGLALAAWLVPPALFVASYSVGDPVPWRASFLAFAADRSILTRAENEYRFIHLLIRDHLAACDPDLLATAVDRRRAELGPV